MSWNRNCHGNTDALALCTVLSTLSPFKGRSFVRTSQLQDKHINTVMNMATLETCVALLLICLVPVLGLAYYTKIQIEDDVQLNADLLRADPEFDQVLERIRSSSSKLKKVNEELSRKRIAMEETMELQR